MADLSDVLDMIYDNAVLAIYPDGTNNPSVANVDITIVKGWPIREKLDETLRSGKAMVSIFPTSEEKTVTHYPRDFKPLNKSAPTLTAVVSGQTVTIGGTISVPQAIMININGRHPGYAYQVVDSDSLDSIASALAALIPAASSIGNVITIPGANPITTGITTSYTAGQELGRQERVFKIIIWSPTPTLRPVISAPIDIYFRKNYQIPLSDGFYSHIWYSKTSEEDDLQVPFIYRRDLSFRVQYATTNVEIFTTITDPYVNSLQIAA